MKMHLRTRRFAAAFLLLALLAAYAGQKVHIYLEDHAHFAAHCGDLVPDNGARESVVEYCPVDHYHFFPISRRALPRRSSRPRCWPSCRPKPPAAVAHGW